MSVSEAWELFGRHHERNDSLAKLDEDDLQRITVILVCLGLLHPASLDVAIFNEMAPSRPVLSG